MSIERQKKAHSAEESAKKRKTFPRPYPPELKELIQLGDSLILGNASLFSVGDKARLLQDELVKANQTDVAAYPFLNEVLRRCLEGLPEGVRDFITGEFYDIDPAPALQEKLDRYENLRTSLNKLFSLAHVNKLILQRNERLDNNAALARAYFDGQNLISTSQKLGITNLEEYKKKLYRIRDEVELLEWRAVNRRSSLNQMENLVESLRPTIISTSIEGDGTIYFAKDLFSEAIEGVEGAAFRIRECLYCPRIFWAENNKTVVCGDHLRARKNERSNLGTKKNRQAGRGV